MFRNEFSLGPMLSDSVADLAATVSSAIAYGIDLDGGDVRVSNSGGILVLEGTAPIGSFAKVCEIASHLAGARVVNLIQPV